MVVKIQWITEVDRMCDPQDSPKTSPKRFIGTLSGTIGPFSSEDEVCAAIAKIQKKLPTSIEAR